MRVNFLKIALLGSIFILPLLGVYKNFGYEEIKVLFFILSISLIGFLWRGKQFKWTLISKVLGLFVLILLVTSITGIDPKSSLLGNQPYSEGWIIYSYLYLFYLMVKTFKIETKQYAVVLSASALLVSFLAIKDWVLLNILGQHISTYAGRVVSTFGQPNFYAGFLLLTLPFSYSLFKAKDKRLQVLGWGSGIIILIGIMVSYSRSAILMALILIILGLADQLRIIKQLLIGGFAVLVITIFLSLNLSSGFVWKEFIQPTTVSNPDLTRESAEKRAYIWPVAWQLVIQKPVLGYGLENISQAFSNYFVKNKHTLFEENLNISPVLISLKDLNIDRTHNYILDLLLFSGILGLSAWIGVVILLIKKLKTEFSNPYKNILLISLITYLAWIQFQNQSIVHLLYLWLLMGLIDTREVDAIANG